MAKFTLQGQPQPLSLIQNETLLGPDLAQNFLLVSCPESGFAESRVH